MTMSHAFDECLQRGKITKFSPGPRLAAKELRAAKMDLETALKSVSERNYKWGIIQSYYSMFHSARALIYSRGYREKSHFCLIEAVRTLFVETKEVNVTLVEALLEAKQLRESADYYGDFSDTNCTKLTGKATNFLTTTEKILSQKI